MKIGIMTYFRPVNYGAYLQAYALSHRLNQEDDIDAEIVDFHMPEEDDFYKKSTRLQKNLLRRSFCKRRLQVFSKEINKQLLSTQSLCSNNLDDFVSFIDNKYDIVITGSDELWKTNSFRGFPTPYFLPGNIHCKKFSYAVSGRTPFSNMTFEDRDLLRGYLNDFEYIGVRDNATAKNVRELLGTDVEIHRNFDPSFIYDFEPNIDNGKMILREKFHCAENKRIVAVMYNEGRSEKPNLCEYLKREYGNEYEFISLYNWSSSIKKYASLTPLDWKDVIAAVDGVISSYFHGICFSMVMGKPFLAIDKRAKGNDESKLFDLLSEVNQLERYSVSLDKALNEEKVTHFMQEVSCGTELDFSDTVMLARNEFALFIEQLRKE